MSTQEEMVRLIKNRGIIESKTRVSECLVENKVENKDGQSNTTLVEQLRGRTIDLDKISIEYLNLSTRANNSLKTYHIDSVLKLINCSDNYLLSMRNLGQSSLHQIKEKISCFVEYLEYLNLIQSLLMK